MLSQVKEDSNGYTLKTETCMMSGEHGHKYTSPFKKHSFVELKVDRHREVCDRMDGTR